MRIYHKWEHLSVVTERPSSPPPSRARRRRPSSELPPPPPPPPWLTTPPPLAAWRTTASRASRIRAATWRLVLTRGGLSGASSSLAGRLTDPRGFPFPTLVTLTHGRREARPVPRGGTTGAMRPPLPTAAQSRPVSSCAPSHSWLALGPLPGWAARRWGDVEGLLCLCSFPHLEAL